MLRNPPTLEPSSTSPPKKGFWCRVGLHKSDRDYGIRWHDKAVISTCEKCNTQIVHRNLWWTGGGNI